MFLSTRGIVFRQTKYSDTSLVVKILTEEAGLCSYIIKGARGPKAKIKASLFQPLNLLDLVVSHKEKSELHHIREARVAYQFKTIPGDIRKSSILLFLDELLYKSIQEEVINAGMFNFIYDQLLQLDQANCNPANFHLLFTIRLTHYLGFFPQGNYLNANTVFDLAEGHFSQVEPLPAEIYISGLTCQWFSKLIEVPVEDSGLLQVPPSVRSELIEKMLSYYHHHLPLSGAFKSHIVLHEVLK